MNDRPEKLTMRLDIPVSESLSEILTVLAHASGVSRAEYARGVIERAVFGDLVMYERITQSYRSNRWEHHRTDTRDMDRDGGRD